MRTQRKPLQSKWRSRTGKPAFELEVPFRCTPRDEKVPMLLTTSETARVVEAIELFDAAWAVLAWYRPIGKWPQEILDIKLDWDRTLDSQREANLRTGASFVSIKDLTDMVRIASVLMPTSPTYVHLTAITSSIATKDKPTAYAESRAEEILVAFDKATGAMSEAAAHVTSASVRLRVFRNSAMGSQHHFQTQLSYYGLESGAGGVTRMTESILNEETSVNPDLQPPSSSRNEDHLSQSMRSMLKGRYGFEACHVESLEKALDDGIATLQGVLDTVENISSTQGPEPSQPGVPPSSSIPSSPLSSAQSIATP
jgi:hypothetical protein